jgi:hypothetical protein
MVCTFRGAYDEVVVAIIEVGASSLLEKFGSI